MAEFATKKALALHKTGHKKHDDWMKSGEYLKKDKQYQGK